MTTTNEQEFRRIARSRIRIKRFLDDCGDIVYKLQRKHWFGWTNVPNRDLGWFWYKTYSDYETAVEEAKNEINREYNRLIYSNGKKSKYFYYPF